jgi:hypothetical protein
MRRFDASLDSERENFLCGYHLMGDAEIIQRLCHIMGWPRRLIK